MIAVHFGAGNIGRGFIGALLSGAGYEVYFADINKEVIDALNEKGKYEVRLASDENESFIVSGVKGINSNENAEEIIAKIAEADLITTAVGPNILKFVAKTIALGLKEKKTEANVIACENMIGGTDHLKSEIFKHLNEEEQHSISEWIGFPNSAVDRIVPIQENADILSVSVEPFFEWVIEQSKVKGSMPSIQGVTYVDDLIPYIERKLFTVNTGHAVTAYAGYQKGLATVKEAIEDAEVRSLVEGALSETSTLLVKEYGFDEGEHLNYVKKIIARFENKHISDEVTRVGRSPKRKLGFDDRLVAPARRLLEKGITPDDLAAGIAAGLKYDFDKDEEAVEIQQLIQEKGISGALQEVSQLPENHPLIGLVEEKYHKL
ncbi:mannitol-1-phosphate 5-dehydrogenase [Bacillus idriensis]|uniref:Mannitol-1-phosphate 5-dehydrogenase n=1 Tax=Metabacillus idriensis TaxID=324768 RepID=A0A6I2MHB4_9BACI|nr:mannitol-1-phosphate 5-dehydrogenase [Metabacillus idriensis]MRX56517.1 mannitol-1-phosphate 5-dehydrogenase [Metabacillus idriensis]